jgi:phosphosulfolactate synthase (CoM biosynthesis protein A)
MEQYSNRFIDFLKTNYREPKPRTTGLTEIRGPYYSASGPAYLNELFQMMGPCIDSLKFAGGSFAVIEPKMLQAIIDTAHAHDVLVSTGGFIEYVLTQGKKAVEQYLHLCKEFGFDII